MASFFGEVLPVTSRCGDDDDEDEILPQLSSDENTNLCLEWMTNFAPEESKSIDTLILSFGQCAKALQRLQILDGFERIGVINDDYGGSTTIAHERKSDDNVCILYRSSKLKQTCVCFCPFNIPEYSTLTWCETLINGFTNKINVTILSSAHISEYKSDSANSEITLPCIRKLSNSSVKSVKECSSTRKVATLPQPNFVSGPAAQMLTYCQVKKIPATLYQMYIETQFMDNIALSSYKKLLETIGWNLSEISLNSVPVPQDSSLYL